MEDAKVAAGVGFATAKTFMMLGAVGVVIGIGQLLASKEELTWRIVIGRALSSAGIGCSAAAVLVWLPEVPLIAQFGIAAALASLGTSGLERLVQRAFGGNNGGA